MIFPCPLALVPLHYAILAIVACVAGLRSVAEMQALYQWR
jgi:hypothetical protein